MNEKERHDDVSYFAHSFQFGGGGDFGGGGAGGSWGESVSSSSTVSSASSASGGIGFDLDFEEGWLIIIAAVALFGGLIASFYVIYIAPSLLAEILVDGALVADRTGAHQVAHSLTCFFAFDVVTNRRARSTLALRGYLNERL